MARLSTVLAVTVLAVVALAGAGISPARANVTLSPSTPPSITGSAHVDATLTANNGTWPGSGPGWTFSYVWMDCNPNDPTSCVTIDGATASTYIVDPADGGAEIEVVVSAQDGLGDFGSATSSPTPVVTAAAGAPVPLADATIGPVTGGVAATATDGAWTNNPTSYSSTWLSCAPDLTACADVGSSDSTSYTPVIADVGHVLVFIVYATNAAGDSVVSVSSPSVVVAFPPPTISLVTPADGQVFESFPMLGGGGSILRAAYANYNCVAPTGMLLASCTGTSGQSKSIPATPGQHTFSVTAVDVDGQSATRTVTYYVGAQPRATLVSPTNGATYVQGAVVALQYSCSDLPGALSTLQCWAIDMHPCGGVAPMPGTVCSTVPGGNVDTTTLGQHQIVVSARNFGTTTTTSVNYTVVTPPPVAITGLRQTNATWRLGPGLPTVSVARRRAVVGTKFTFTTSGAASVTFAFDRLIPGRVRGARCVATARAARRRGRPCSRTVAAGTFTELVRAGSNAITFDGHVSATRALAPGAYRVTISAQPVPISAAAVPAAPAWTVRAGTLAFAVTK